MLADAAGLAALHRLGARSVPVVARGERFVYAQSIAAVIDFLGLDAEAGPALSPAELAARLDLILAAAARFARQMPDDQLDTELPNRPRSYRVLLHHIFRIAESFLEVARGRPLAYEMLTAAPAAAMASAADIAAYGEQVRAAVAAWWADRDDKALTETVPTYYGMQPLAEVLERTTWHAGQHVRQAMSLLEGLGIVPNRPLTPQDFAGLPLPDKVWDE